ncbi:MAG: MFS transporter, partial [Lysinibacillus sp.]
MNRWVALLIISLSVLFALSLWFSATAVIPQLVTKWQLNDQQSASVTTAVQLGFIIGALFLTSTSLPDRINGRYLFAFCASVGALSNFLFTLSPVFEVGLLLRFVTGATLVGVYPTAVQLVSLWFVTRKGTAVGIIIGALTIGSALPHLIKAFASDLQWQIVIYASSCLALFASIIILFLLPDVLTTQKKQTIKGNTLLNVLRNRRVMLANYGYFGHMWELYAMWTWLPLFLTTSFQQGAHSPIFVQLAPIFAFCIIGIAGAIGAICGGLLADKIGKARLAK